MIYLLDRFEPDLIKVDSDKYMNFTMWKTTEERVKVWIANERCRSIFSRKEIINLFNTGKIQMVQVDNIKLEPYDKVIVWTDNNNIKNYYVIEIKSYHT